jgi:CDP-diacylglycerol--glycerol-3-phosphate 3-phosphatidyltransferase
MRHTDSRWELREFLRPKSIVGNTSLSRYTVTMLEYSVNLLGTSGSRKVKLCHFRLSKAEDSLNDIATGELSTVLSLSQIRKALAYRFTEPVARLLAKTAITPNVITWLGFLLAVGAAVLIVTGHPVIAGLIVLIAGFPDILDGALARYIKRSTRFGAILDSTLDRLSEAAVLLGILVLYAREQLLAQTLLTGITLLGSSLVSYIRARAEATGLECQVGLFTRAERVIVLALGLLLSQIAYALVIALGIVAVFSFVTFGQRLVYVWQQTKVQEKHK